ncbi:hypothetical protein [Massilia terrae]|uniref:Lipoprotein n=1 Tax=Massilia terrae TaxID=1811224 RepID=A0ABT2CYN3_9BURK|nr:hypothetical protein [Massilia terrae]MCS0658671.1 hypothetical protein [Massilia terrae]
MDTRHQAMLRRVLAVILLGCGLGGCAVYGPPYAGYDPYYYPAYGYPTYVGPPISLDLGFGFYDGGYRGRGGRGWGGWGRGYGRR